MAPWIETTLRELEAAHATAQQNLTEADAAHTAAQKTLEDAQGKRDELYHLLRDFRDFARAREEGGAP